MSALHPDSESPQDPSSQIEAAAREGRLMIDQAIRHLENVGILPSLQKRLQRPVRLSPEILMELAAVLRLSSWLDGGLYEPLKEEVSEAFAALEDTEAKLAADSHAFDGLEGLPPVTDKLFGIWEKHLASSGLEELSADVLLDVSPEDEEELLKDFANLLWDHRHTGQQQPEN